MHRSSKFKKIPPMFGGLCSLLKLNFVSIIQVLESKEILNMYYLYSANLHIGLRFSAPAGDIKITFEDYSNGEEHTFKNGRQQEFNVIQIGENILLKLTDDNNLILLQWKKTYF